MGSFFYILVYKPADYIFLHCPDSLLRTIAFMISRNAAYRTPATGHTIQVISQRIVVKLQIRYTANAIAQYTPSYFPAALLSLV